MRFKPAFARNKILYQYPPSFNDFGYSPRYLPMAERFYILSNSAVLLIINIMEERKFGRRGVPAKRDIAERLVIGGFSYSFGAYPEGEYFQAIGYDSKYLKEEACFHYHIALPHERLMGAFLSLCGLMPAKAHLVIKIHSSDYYRDHDTYISESAIERSELVEWMQNWRDVVLDDGFFGLGLFAEGETAEIFLDEHKTIQIYHNDPDLMENTLERMGIPFMMDMGFYFDNAHYHEPLPLDGDFNADYLTAFEDLADRYELYLDEDEFENTDDEGAPIGITCWKVEIRGFRPESMENPKPQGFYSTLYLNAESRKEAIEQVEDYLRVKEEEVDLYLQMARVPSELVTSEMWSNNSAPGLPGVWYESERIFFDWGRV